MYRFLQNPTIPYAGWCHRFKTCWIFKHFVSFRRESITFQSTRPCWPKQTPQTRAPQRRPPPDLSLLETPGWLGKIALSYPFSSYMLRLICICISDVKNQSVCPHYSWGIFQKCVFCRFLNIFLVSIQYIFLFKPNMNHISSQWPSFECFKIRQRVKETLIVS